MKQKYKNQNKQTHQPDTWVSIAIIFGKNQALKN